MTPSAAGWPGHDERRAAQRLVGTLAPEHRAVLEWQGVGLDAGAEHLLYTALLRPGGPAPRSTPGRAWLRLARAMLRARRAGPVPRRERPRILVLVTQPIHVTLLQPIAASLERRGVESLVVDAETRAGRRVRAPGVADRLVNHLDSRSLAPLASHAGRVHRTFDRPPPEWREWLGDAQADRLSSILRRGLSLLALDAARLATLFRRTEPQLVACFNESGMLARVAPAAARRAGLAVVDLPHAEANDPNGTAGAGYDTLLVYGPRSRQAMEAAGIAPSRIVEIGPLRYDPLLARGSVPPRTEPRRVVFASQPVDAEKPALNVATRLAVVDAAIAATAALAPAELVFVPHPTEAAGEAERFVAALAPPPTVRIRVARDLHGSLEGAWLLVTGSSQSVFDAVVSGVPAITVNPSGGPDPVTFARDGIALGVGSASDAATTASRLSDAGTRKAVADRQRAALGDRIGPIDGRAAERAADHLAGLVAAARR